MHKPALVSLITFAMLAACGNDSNDRQTIAPTGDGPDTQLPVAADDTPDFLSKDMSWMPTDIWLPDDFEPRQSQKLSPVADTYLLRGITQMSAAELAETFTDRMTAAGYEPYDRAEPQPGRLLFRGNGHGSIVITISEAGTGREVVVSVENASGR